MLILFEDNCETREEPLLKRRYKKNGRPDLSLYPARARAINVSLCTSLSLLLQTVSLHS